jgi:UPF0755 protein
MLSGAISSANAETVQCKTGEITVELSPGTASLPFQGMLMSRSELEGKIAVPKEASLLPGTHCFAKGAKRKAVIARFSTDMKARLSALWDERSPLTAVKSKKEALILASLVEKETLRDEDYGLIAALFTNRLRLGMMLQVDATIIYPITGGLALDRAIRSSEVADDNGYNTYARTGLPKGPITNPSEAAIHAVLNPPESGVLFMVADGTGGHVFANTLEEHNANVEKWYAIRRERGEM